MTASSARREAGQAAVELVAAVPLLLAAGAVVLQLLAVGHAQSLADGAAEAGAIAVSDGREPERAAVGALPDWAGSGAEVSQVGGRVSVRLRPPVIVPGLDRELEVDGRAWARPAAGGPP